LDEQTYRFNEQIYANGVQSLSPGSVRRKSTHPGTTHHTFSNPESGSTPFFDPKLHFAMRFLSHLIANNDPSSVIRPARRNAPVATAATPTEEAAMGCAIVFPNPPSLAS
jgi:hypothetical protein